MDTETPPRDQPQFALEEPVFVAGAVQADAPGSLGKYSYLMTNCHIHPHVTIGRYTSIADNVQIGATPHPHEWLSTHPFQYNPLMPHLPSETLTIKKWDRHENMRPTFIGNDVWIGTNAVVMQGVIVGDGAVVGAGAVVTKDVPPYAIVLGVPAKIVRYRFEKDIIKRLLDLKWWELDIEQLHNIDYDNVLKAIIQIGMVKDKLKLGKL